MRRKPPACWVPSAAADQPIQVEPSARWRDDSELITDTTTPHPYPSPHCRGARGYSLEEALPPRLPDRPGRRARNIFLKGTASSSPQPPLSRGEEYFLEGALPPLPPRPPLSRG